MKKLLLLSALIALVAACGSNPEPAKGSEPPAPSAQNAEIAPTLSAEAFRGKDLFETQCVACHAVDQKLIGPALAGVDKRHSEEWLLKFIRNSQEMIKSGDPVALKLYEENNKLAMNSFEHLSDEQIRDILTYIKEIAEKK